MSVPYASLFSQLLGEIDRNLFQRLVRESGAERRSKGFACWDQFVAMLFCQTAQAKSLREIDSGLRSCEGKLRHLGLAKAPGRSTLSYANAHRPWELYRAVFDQTFARCQAEAALRTRRKFRFKHKLLSLDSSMVELCAETFDWARYKRAKGALKRR